MKDNPASSYIESQDPIRKGRFYFIFENPEFYFLTDKTKRGLEMKDIIVDEKTGIKTIRGMIYDMDGIGHKVAIKWLYPKSRYEINSVVGDAEKMEKRYREIREMTCPDDV
jgi:hypothetical protein